SQCRPEQNVRQVPGCIRRVHECPIVAPPAGLESIEGRWCSHGCGGDHLSCGRMGSQIDPARFCGAHDRTSAEAHASDADVLEARCSPVALHLCLAVDGVELLDA